jgi:3D (Asp-Asp-Asp) domain-containing protein
MNDRTHLWLRVGFLCLVAGAPLGCSDASRGRHSAKVTATAYNSLPAQTEGDPTLAAWGDKLKPGMKAIAVSRDLVEKGLTRGVKVKIDGLRGTYRVLDTMHARWTDRIDIYLGDDVDAAKEWGKNQVRIHWN